MKKIGKLKARHSKEIKNSKMSIGFESLDRGMFNPEPCYDKVGELGVKFARCQTGWCLCEKAKVVYDFQWLDGAVYELEFSVMEWWQEQIYYGDCFLEHLPLYDYVIIVTDRRAIEIGTEIC